VERVITNNSGAAAWVARRSRSVQLKKRIRDRRHSDQSAAGLRNNTQVDETGPPENVGIVVFEQMATADLMGPADVFSRPTITTDNGHEHRYYQVVTIGVSAKPCVTESGIVLEPQVDMQHAPLLDTIIIPGGSGNHDPKLNRRITEWLNCRAPATRRIAALGEGIYPLAATNMLNGRQVVVHWRFAKDIALQFPRLRINARNLFAKDGGFYTCAGGISAVDLSLALIDEDLGRQVALRLARDLVLPLKRSGGYEQYSEPLKFQIQSSDRLADLPAWISSHLGHDLSVDRLAEIACMSRRNFTRLFKKTFGKSPSQFVTDARIAEARERLLGPRNSIESVANSVGFRSADVFSVAFERHMGIRPRTYRGLRKPLARKASPNVKPHRLRM
jgi:transcriptional regulator GlxA family with amidase domain